MMLVVVCCSGCGGPSSLAAQTHGRPTARPGRVLTMHGSRETPLPAPGNSLCCVLPSRIGWLTLVSAICAAVYVGVLRVCTDLLCEGLGDACPVFQELLSFAAKTAKTQAGVGQCTAY